MAHRPDAARTVVFALTVMATATGSVAQAAESQVDVSGSLDKHAAEKAFPMKRKLSVAVKKADRPRQQGRCVADFSV